MKIMRTELRLSYPSDIVVENGGLFSSRGRGFHPQRVLTSFELILVRRGQLMLKEEDQRFVLQPGEALLLFPGRAHKGIGRFPEGLQFYWLHFQIPDPGGEIDAANSFEVCQHVKLENPSRMIELFRQFLHDQETGRLGPLTAPAYVRLMLANMVSEREELSRTGREVNPHSSHVEQYIRTHFHEPIQPAMIAAHLHLNVDYLGRLYKQAFGMTLTEGIQRERIKKAREFLLDSDANINEIARECGYTSSAYFRRCFEKFEGLSPTSWRKRHSIYRTNTA
jgi:AraC-like DNA-binding protein